MRKLIWDVETFVYFVKFYDLHWIVLPWLALVPWSLFWLDYSYGNQAQPLEEPIEIFCPYEAEDDSPKFSEAEHY